MQELEYILINSAWIAVMQGTVQWPLPFCWYVANDGSTWCRIEVVNEYMTQFTDSGQAYTVVTKPDSDFPSPLTATFS